MREGNKYREINNLVIGAFHLSSYYTYRHLWVVSTAETGEVGGFVKEKTERGCDKRGQGVVRGSWRSNR